MKQLQLISCITCRHTLSIYLWLYGRCYTVDQWKAFTDEEIAVMAEHALKFWKKYRRFLLTDV